MSWIIGSAIVQVLNLKKNSNNLIFGKELKKGNKNTEPIDTTFFKITLEKRLHEIDGNKHNNHIIIMTMVAPFLSSWSDGFRG